MTPTHPLKKKEENADEVTTWLDRLFVNAGKKSDDIPHELDINIDDFRAFRDNWTLWRNLGHHIDGSWVAPVSFLEALRIPKAELDIYFILDDVFGRMQRQFAKKNKDNG